MKTGIRRQRARLPGRRQEAEERARREAEELARREGWWSLIDTRRVADQVIHRTRPYRSPQAAAVTRRCIRTRLLDGPAALCDLVLRFSETAVSGLDAPCRRLAPRAAAEPASPCAFTFKFVPDGHSADRTRALAFGRRRSRDVPSDDTSFPA